uniref:hypothetical protein n=1 Tax=Ileibacterium valens TaxID=1862668 RepID=UPI002572856F
ISTGTGGSKPVQISKGYVYQQLETEISMYKGYKGNSLTSTDVFKIYDKKSTCWRHKTEYAAF